MANFKTHLQFSTILCGMASTALLQQNIISGEEALLCWLAGSLGGILPDIDSDNSHSLSIIFWILSLTAAALSTLYTLKYLSLSGVWVICSLSFLSVYFLARSLFKSMTVHRGIFHSLIAAITVALGVTCGLYYLGSNPTTSWFIGGFVGFGYVLHLLLDEIYAVNFAGVSLKRSFGSALKPLDRNNWPASALFMGVCSVLFYLSPLMSWPL